MRRILITGITGFLGSHIAEYLINNQVEVIGLKRVNSNIWRCRSFESKVSWVNIHDDDSYREKLSGMKFDTIIHCAWMGVEAVDRDNWNQQVKNIDFLVSLFDVAKAVGVKKIIFLGSQAEYGNINCKVDEGKPPRALNAYGGIKLGSMAILKAFCELNDISWIWLRLFSIFGERENSSWLIPSLVRNMLNTEKMDLTAGEQIYAYLYVKDFAAIVKKIVDHPVESGVYNISSNECRTIRSLIENVRDIVKPNFELNFGALSYRPNQSMHMEGDISKIFSQIGEVQFTNFNVALRNTLTYYINN